MDPTKNARIWQVISLIPKGRVATYGQVARMAGLPNHARMVGSVLKQLPNGSGLPWHRVINSKGCLSFPRDSKQFSIQKEKLEAEGVTFDNQKVSLQKFQWQGE
ncbi:MGMT family protein [Spartinivicinus ruber]|uniref:MGMT family protein n=1 Tax=Spartinivicinus ruber TaxID=2683272 RepID=UPI0013D3CE1B|nr:MGMT family protein [Spartinivicinus ruber]